MSTSSPRSLTTSLTAAFALLLATPTPSRADDSADPVVQYRDLVARGSAQFDAGDWATARATFEAAYALHAEPILLFNIASCYRRQGDYKRAIVEYRRYLAESNPDDPRRTLAAETIKDLEATIAARETTPPDPSPPAPADEQVIVDEESSAPAPGAPADAASDASVSSSTSPGIQAHTALRWTGIACGVASLVTGAFALSASADADDAEARLSTLAPGTAWDDDQQALYDRGQRAQRRTLIFTAASAALVTTGVVLYITGERRRHHATTMTVAPTGDGGMVSLARPF